MQHRMKKFKPQRVKSYQFVAVPKMILYDERFAEVSLHAKWLYIKMLDRASLSAEHRDDFTDENGDIYIIFTNEEIAGELHCGKNLVTRFTEELVSFGLIEKRKQGQGKPTMYYVMDFSTIEETHDEQIKPTEAAGGIPESQNQGIKNNAGGESGNPEGGNQESPKQGANNNYYNKKNRNKNNQSQSIPPNLPLEGEGRTEGRNLYSLYSEEELREGICQQIGYEYLLDNGAAGDLLDCIVSVMCEALREGKPVMTRNKEYPFALVRQELEKLDYTHIEFVMGNLRKANDVKNPRKYLLTMLLNAAIDSEFHTEVEVQKDFYEDFGKWEEQAHSGRDWSEVSRQASLKTSPELPGSKNDLDDFLAELGG